MLAAGAQMRVDVTTREVVEALREAGVEPILSAPTAVRQDWSSERGRELPPEVLAEDDLETLLDAILALPAGGGRADAA